MRRELLILGLVLLLIGGCIGYVIRGAGWDRYEIHDIQAGSAGGIFILDRKTGNLYVVLGARAVQQVESWPPKD